MNIILLSIGRYYSTILFYSVLDVISCKILQNNNNWLTSVAQMLHLLWDRSQAIGRFPYYWEVLWILKSSCTGLVVVTWPARGQQEKKGTPGWRSWKVLQRIVKDLAKILDTSCEILPRFAKLCFFCNSKNLYDLNMQDLNHILNISTWVFSGTRLWLYEIPSTLIQEILLGSCKIMAKTCMIS